MGYSCNGMLLAVFVPRGWIAPFPLPSASRHTKATMCTVYGNSE